MSTTISNTRNYVEERPYKELAKASKLLTVFAIIKDGNLAGRITARRTKSGAVHVVLFMYPTFANERSKRHALYGYKQMTGSGYDKISAGIAEVLAGNQRELLESYNVNIDSHKDKLWSIGAAWMLCFADAGFAVIQVL